MKCDRIGDVKGLVSIITPTYKRVGMLGRAIESILKQTYNFIEVIIVDDNDEDSIFRKETEEFMKQYESNTRVIYLKHKKNKNGSAARNTGIQYSNGEYIAFLDDDDEFLPEKIEKQVERLRKLDNSWGGVYCGCNIIRNQKCYKKTENLSEGNLKKELLLMRNGIYGGSTLLIRKDILLELNGFDESFIRHQDWELMVRFFRKYKLSVVNERLVNIHVDSDINRVNTEKLKRVKDKFLSTFEQDIKQFDYKTQCQILKVHNLLLMNDYLLNREYRIALDYYNKIRRICRISLKEYVIIILSILEPLTNVRLKETIVKLFMK